MSESSTAMRWYFAYGSNMLRTQMIARTGAADPAIVCRLPGYRLAFNKLHLPTEMVVANMIPSPSDEVWGVAYHCTAMAIQALDLWEKVLEDSYRHHQVEVHLKSGEKLQALAYIGSPSSICDDRQPPDEYLQRIISGARQNGLPTSYIESISHRAKSAPAYEQITI